MLAVPGLLGCVVIARPRDDSVVHEDKKERVHEEKVYWSITVLPA